MSPSGRSERGLAGVLALPGFRRLWIGQIFSQLADKFYIVLMVFLIAQYWVTDTPQSNEALAEAAAAIRMSFETRAQMITLLATGIYVANTVPAMLLGTVAGVWADRWPKRSVMVASNGLRAALALLAPFCLLPGPMWLGLSWGYWALVVMTFWSRCSPSSLHRPSRPPSPCWCRNQPAAGGQFGLPGHQHGGHDRGLRPGRPDPAAAARPCCAQVGIAGGEFVLLPLCYGLAALAIAGIAIAEPPPEPRSITGLAGDRRGTAGAAGAAQCPQRHAAAGAALQPAGGPLRAGDQPGGGDRRPRPHPLRHPAGHERRGAGPRGPGGGPAGRPVQPPPAGHCRPGHDRLEPACCWASCAAISCSPCCSAALLGVGAALLAIPAQTTIQEDTPENQRGKVFGLQNNLINIALSLPLVLAGTVVSRYGLLPVLWALAAIAGLAALASAPGGG